MAMAGYDPGVAVGFWQKADIQQKWQLDKTFDAQMKTEERDRLYKGWQKAVKRTMDWEKE